MRLKEQLKANPYGVSSFVYLAFPIIALFSNQIWGPKWLLVICIAIFSIDYYLMIFYVNEWTQRRNKVVLLFIHLLGIVYFCFSIGSAFIMFFFFGAFALPYVYQVSVKSLETYLYLAAMILTSVYLAYFYMPNVIIVIISDIVILIIAFTNFQNVQNEKNKKLIEAKNQYINLLIAEQERQRIGQDLHDTLGHVFASLSIKSELALRLMEMDLVKAKAEMVSVNKLSKEALQKVREIVDQLKFQNFQEEVLSVNNLLQQVDIKFHFEGGEYARTLNQGQQSTLSMILREAVNNIIKHADASEVSGCLFEKGKKVYFCINDNGKGIQNIDVVLHSIEERVKLLNGRLTTRSNQGLEIEIEFPRGEN